MLPNLLQRPKCVDQTDYFAFAFALQRLTRTEIGCFPFQEESYQSAAIEAIELPYPTSRSNLEETDAILSNMTRSFAFAPGEFYHVYNRGTEKRNIFSSRADYDRFLALLYLCNQASVVHLQLQGRTLKELSGKREGEPLVAIVAYCLMPNHFHLLLREVADGGISKFMQKLTTGYTMYFNKKNERSGSLFQGKFKATYVADDRYLRYLVSYIHLNPMKLIEPKWKEIGISDRAAAERYLAQYGPSSYRDYLNETRVENVILSPDVLPEYFDSGMEFKELVTEWLTYGPD